MSLRLPHFIIAGAPRAGTSWLWALAKEHPDIQVVRTFAPEPKFFLVDDLYRRGLEYYSHTWFAELPPAALYGEKSANYLESPVVAERIKKDLPDAKLIFILRNPVDRAYSNYLWSTQNGWETEAFERALELEAEREAAYDTPETRFARPFSYFSRGLYADFLDRYHAHFSPEQILVLRTEDIVQAPMTLAKRFFEFLEVDAAVDPRTLGIVNATTDKRSRMSESARRSLIERYRLPNLRLSKLLGPAFELWDD